MIPLYEYIISKDNIENVSKLNKDEVSIIKSILKEEIEKFNFDIRVIKTGNIELKSIDAIYTHGRELTSKPNMLSGVKFVFYIKSNPMILRRQYMTIDAWTKKEIWSNPPSNMKTFDNIEDMAEYLKKWMKKNLYI